FSVLGEETSDFIPAASSATPNGDFYWICVDRDYLGRWKLIADRNIQSGISWDTLNSLGIASESGFPIYVDGYTYKSYNKLIYVDSQNGDDNLGDGSKDVPYRTIQKAISSVNVNNTAIILKPGIYN